MSQYIFQRTGGPILRWDHGAPRQSQAADARSLGAFGMTSVFPPGSPEPLAASTDFLTKLWNTREIRYGILALGAAVLGWHVFLRRKKRFSKGGYRRNPSKRRKRHRRGAVLRKRLRGRRRSRKAVRV